MKKVLMESDNALETVNRIKSIIESLNEQIISPINSDDLEKMKERLTFMQKNLIDAEVRYEKLKNNDSPYYKDGSFQHYNEIFKNLSYSNLDSTLAREVVYCTESDRTKNKLGTIKNIVKAYNLREEELTKEMRSRWNNK